MSKRLLLLTTLKLVLSQVDNEVVPAQEVRPSTPPVQHSPPPAIFDDNSASRLLESTITPRPASQNQRLPIAEGDIHNTENSAIVKIQAGELYAFLDLPTASMMLQLSQNLQNWPDRADNTTIERSSPTPEVSLQLNSIDLHLCESVPEMDSLLDLSDFHPKPFDDAILTLSFRDIVLQTPLRYEAALPVHLRL